MEKKIVSINSLNCGSTGKIMMQISELAEKKGYKSYVAYGDFRNNKELAVKNAIVIGNQYGRNLSMQICRVFGRLEQCVPLATYRVLKQLDKLKPDLIHLHNIHGGYIHIGMLFSYIKKHKIPVVWTLHDCWSITGHCPYFTFEKCEKWKTGCFDCVKYKKYPESYIDNSKWAWKYKKKCFSCIQDLTLVTPSQWLANLVKQSYLGDYKIKVINNGIALNIFKPRESGFRKKYDLQDKKVLLGVAFNWSNKKGLDVFIKLAGRLNNKYQIVLVGTNDKVDAQLPKNIISIHRTQNQEELAEIYSTADLFVNPTREDNYPTVNMEAIACGTPVITFNTGGSPECIDNTCGSVVEYDDIDSMEREIRSICENSIYSTEACMKKAAEFDKNEKFDMYLDLYNDILSKK